MTIAEPTLHRFEGLKIQDEDDLARDEYNQDVLGHPLEQVDNSVHEHAFIWTCCGEEAFDAGCNSTRHKCKDNTIVVSLNE